MTALPRAVEDDWLGTSEEPPPPEETSGSDNPPPPERPSIQVLDGRVDLLATAAEEAIIASELPIFQRGR